MKRSFTVLTPPPGTTIFQMLTKEIELFASTLKNSGNEDLSLTHFNNAVKICNEVYPTFPYKVAKIHFAMGYAYFQIKNYQKAMDFYLKALNIVESAEEGPLEDLYLSPSEKMQFLYEMYIEIGECYLNQGDLQNTKIYLEKSVPYYNFESFEEKSKYFLLLGNVKADLKEYQNIHGYFETALEYALKTEKKSLKIAKMLATLGEAYEMQSIVDKAAENYRKSIDVYEELLPNATALNMMPKVVFKYIYVLNYLQQFSEAGEIALRVGKKINKFSGKKEEIEFYSNLFETIFDSKSLISILQLMIEYYKEIDDPECISHYCNMHAESLILNGQFDEALEIAKESLKYIKTSGKNQYALNCYIIFSKIYIHQKEFEEAKIYIDLSESILKNYQDKQKECEIYYHWFLYYLNTGDMLEAEKYLKQNIGNTPESEETGQILSVRYSELGSIYQNQLKLDRALECFTKAHEIFTRYYNPESADAGNLLEQIGLVHAMLKNFEKALEYLFSSLSIKQKTLSDMDGQLISLYYNLSTTYAGMEEFLMALEYAEKMPDIVKAVHGEHFIDLAVIYGLIGEIQQKLMNRKKAKQFYSLAREVYLKNEQYDEAEQVNTLISEVDL